MERAPAIAAIMTEEIGATFGWGMFNCDLAAAHAARGSRAGLRRGRRGHPVRRPRLCSPWVRQPAGVVVGIAPWNAPVILATRAVATPLASATPSCSRRSESARARTPPIVAALHDAGMPAGVVNLIINAPEDAADVVEALIAHPAVRRVNFTGSTRVGRMIAEKCAGTSSACLLELGGKAPLVVLADADLDAAAAAATFGAFMNQGQICMSTERIVADRAVADALGAKLAGAPRPHGRRPARPGHQIGPLINDASREHVLELIEDARAKGAEVLAGGEADGNVYRADRVAGVTPEMRIYAEESFGPVVSIVAVDGADEAVRVANDTDYGLSAAVFSRDVPRALDVARRIESRHLPRQRRRPSTTSRRCRSAASRPPAGGASAGGPRSRSSPSCAGSPCRRPSAATTRSDVIRPARDDELELLLDIEREAGRAFLDVGMPEIARDDPGTVEDVRGASVAVDEGDRPVAYLTSHVVDGAAHIAQVSVHPSHARRGLGAALIDHLAARSRGARSR